MSRTRKQLIREGQFVAEVEITLIDDETPWSPHVLKEDVEKVDRVRLALRKGDVAAAARESRVYELLPVSA
jgi:hypothetical protein